MYMFVHTVFVPSLLFIKFGEAFGLFPAEVLPKKNTNQFQIHGESIDSTCWVWLPPVAASRFHQPPSFHCLTLQRLVSSFGNAAGDARKIAGGGSSRWVKLHMARFSKKIECLIDLLGVEVKQDAKNSWKHCTFYAETRIVHVPWALRCIKDSLDTNAFPIQRDLQKVENCQSFPI